MWSVCETEVSRGYMKNLKNLLPSVDKLKRFMEFSFLIYFNNIHTASGVLNYEKGQSGSNV